MKREIEPKLVQFIEERLRGEPGYRDALMRQDARAVFLFAARALVGVREVGGNNQGPIVELIQETIGGHGGEAWCMSLVQSCLAFAESKTLLVSPVFASEHCLTVWAETPKAQRVQHVPAPGAIVIWRHGSSASGHTGITAGPVEAGLFDAIEGNTESGIAGGKVERDGGGVYRTRRSMGGAGKMRVVGFLKPF